MREVYFPSNCLVSLLTLVEGHRALEVGLVGREGMIGARLALGATRSSVRALVQGTGTAMRMNAERFLREFRRSQALQRAAAAVHRYADGSRSARPRPAIVSISWKRAWRAGC